MTGSRRNTGCTVFALLLLATCTAAAQTAPQIPFALPEDTALKDPDNPLKKFRIDFARVEHEVPLSRADRMKITPENIEALSQEEVDQVYGRLTAGPIPDGPFFGDLFFAKGDSVVPGTMRLQTRLGEILGGFEGRLADAKVELLEKIGGDLWKGKVFDRKELVLRNMIARNPLLLPFIDDPRTVKTHEIPTTGPLRRRFPTNDVWLLFPAKLYCGQSLLDARRESVIVDYHFSDDIDGYRARPDSLAGRGGLRIRDEIRMVRPGFYLGRAYANRMFLLNFTLFNPEIAERDGAAFAAGGAIAEDCWPAAEQVRAAR